MIVLWVSQEPYNYPEDDPIQGKRKAKLDNEVIKTVFATRAGNGKSGCQSDASYCRGRGIRESVQK
jgi:hypothetical protein